MASINRRLAVDDAGTLALSLSSQGRYDEAALLLQRAVASQEEALGEDSTVVASTLIVLAMIRKSQGMIQESTSLELRAFAIVNREQLPEDTDTVYYLSYIGCVLSAEGRFPESTSVLRHSVGIAERILGRADVGTASIQNLLADSLAQQGENEEAEQLYKRVLSTNEAAFGAQSLNTADSLDKVAQIVATRGRFEEAEPLFRRALRIYENTFGAQHDYSHFHLEMSYWLLAKRRYAEAASELRTGCAEHTSTNTGSQNLATARLAVALSNGCSTAYTLSLWAWAAAGGGRTPNDYPEALKAEAFLVAQRAEESAAGDALARSAARTAATSIGVGAEASAYEAALLDRDNAEQEIENGNRGTLEKGKTRAALIQTHDFAVDKVNRLSAALKIKAPKYWDYRSPQALSVTALQAKSGPDSILLHPDEALLVFCTFPADSVVPGGGQGLVFAVSKERFAWARIGMTTEALKERVSRLRAMIDPQGYETRGAQLLTNEGNRDRSTSDSFDRETSFNLYQALLGDTSIQSVIKDKSTLLWVPSSLLAGLPPALLVTTLPTDGKSRDADSKALRATSWLLRSKAISLLPTVSSLRTLRQILPPAGATTTEPLLAFVDPEFSRVSDSHTPGKAQGATRGFSSYFRGGVPLADALEALPRLPGTRAEGEALMTALGARPDSLLSGHDASKAQLLARNADGRLSKVRVLEFATHGLVAGEAAELAEPALVLAAGAKPEDQLLLASEASTLKLSAEWVLLSACNTGSPDSPGAQGLSGLTRAFFFAGAKSLLVSHWSVRDDVGERLIPAMLLAEQRNPKLPHAQALQQASLAILDDPGLNAANPAAWAPFTLVGEAEQ
jgi:CHAT domain-containing protein